MGKSFIPQFLRLIYLRLRESSALELERALFAKNTEQMTYEKKDMNSQKLTLYLVYYIMIIVMFIFILIIV